MPNAISKCVDGLFFAMDITMMGAHSQKRLLQNAGERQRAAPLLGPHETYRQARRTLKAEPRNRPGQ